MDIEVDINKQKFREKIGLVVFVVAILGIFAAVFAYMIIGHSFDLTASNIDSDVGQLRGYVTVVFEGDNVVRPKVESTSDKILRKAKDFLNIDSESQQQTQGNQDSEIVTEAANADNISQFYKDKESVTCQIKCSDYDAYIKGEIFEKEDWKIGIISVTQDYLTKALASKLAQITIESKGAVQNNNQTKGKSQTSKSVATKTPEMIELENKVKLLKNKEDADFVIIVAPHQDILDICDSADCVLCKTVYDDISDQGKYVNSSFVMRVPESGTIGTILSTPAKSLSGDVYKEVEVQN